MLKTIDYFLLKKQLFLYVSNGILWLPRYEKPIFCFIEKKYNINVMLTIENFKVYWGSYGIYNTFLDGTFTEEQIQSVIDAAVQQYKLLVPCFDLENDKFCEKYKNLALSHIALIALYNVYKNAPAEQDTGKSRIERDYERLKQEFATGIYANNAMCLSLRQQPRQNFEFVKFGKLKTI